MPRNIIISLGQAELHIVDRLEATGIIVRIEGILHQANARVGFTPAGAHHRLEDTTLVQEGTHLIHIDQILTIAVGIGLEDIARAEVGTHQALEEHTGTVGLGCHIINIVLLADVAIVEALVGSTQLVVIG